MTFLDIVFVSVVYGVAESLPIGFAPHFALLSHFNGWQGDAVLFACAQTGLTLAILLHLLPELGQMAGGLWRATKGRVTPGLTLCLHVLAAGLPLLAADAAVRNFGLHVGPFFIGILAILVSLFLLAADRMGITVRRMEHLTLFGSLALGLFRALGVLPGASPLALALIALRGMGYERAAALRFALLLSLPACLMPFTSIGLPPPSLGEGLDPLDMILAGGSAFLVATLSLTLLFRWLRPERDHNRGFTLIVFYRLLLGAALIAASL